MRLRPSCLLALSLALPAVACGSVESVQATLVADNAVNPGRDRVPNPVQVRLYLLSSADKFKGADYFQLSDKEAATLGTDLVTRDQQIIRPGETRTVTIAAKPSAKFLGVAAAYRNIDIATWRATVPIASRVRISLSKDTVTIVPQ